MKAVQVLGDASSPSIAIASNITKPTPKGSEILVHIFAAGITADETTWPELYETPSRIPGHDVSGVIEEFGPDYNGPLIVGQEIYALIGASRGEGQAEYAICLSDEVAIKPKSLSHAEAAALPIPALTAWEAMSDHAQLKEGMSVLITGASGAVGQQLVQLARHVADVKIIALASKSHHENLKNMGASEILDYRTDGWEKLGHKVDAVIDTVGGEVLTKTWESVKEDGVIVTVADPPPPWAFGGPPAIESKAHPGVKYTHFIIETNSQRLAQTSTLIDEGLVKALKVKAFPFDEATQAWAHAKERGRGYKVVIDISTAHAA